MVESWVWKLVDAMAVTLVHCSAGSLGKKTAVQRVVRLAIRKAVLKAMK